MSKDLGEHGQAMLERIEKSPSYIDTLGELVSREDVEIPDKDIKWPFKRVLNSHLIVKIAPPPKGGRIIMPQNKQSRPTKGLVVAVDPDIKDIKVGDFVLYSQFAGYLLKFAQTPLCRCLGYSEVLSTLNDDAPEIESEG